ncbi:subtilisin family serine protease [Modestobacter versicolor]|uniref:Subtilisin family serine protease n=2 Tax=Modestobacter versicolor TaxID=429133 RepID=A0A839YDH3_9ACTN|nr:subtilisin family serine protease [Modestobacter versicolor]
MGPTTSRTTRTGRRGLAVRTGVVAAATALIAAAGAGVAGAAPGGPLDGQATGQAQAELTGEQLEQVQTQLADRSEGQRPAGLPESGPTSFFIEVAPQASSEAYADALPAGEAAADAAASAAKGEVEAAAGQVIDQLPAAVPEAAVLYETSTVLPGVAVRADAADYEQLTQLAGVTAVHPISPKEVSNAGAATVVEAVQAWEDLGNTGRGVSIGIIDTGIDYTHADFGGSGSVAEFDALQAAEAAPAPAGVYPSAKVLGGRDFVGDAYNADPASPAYDPVARPDDNPLDCNGHGTHVAGTAAGYGVNADGSTYTGGYDRGLDPRSLSIGPGMAPEAELYALKVFGCEGSTDVTVQAIEWALDPNGDGSPKDHLDVINLSLGSDYGLADDADALALDRAMKMGVLAVASAGNAGDSYDIGGSPGNAPRAIGVAATNDGFGVFDGWQVTSPAGLVDGTRPGLRSVAYSDRAADGSVKPDVTGALVNTPAGNEDACAPLPAGYATGRILLIEADGFACGSVAKGTNAVNAGAVGFMIIADDDLLETGITGVAQIPGILVTATDGAALRGAVAGGQTVTVTFGPSLKDAAVFEAPEQVDLIASFSSRGVRQENGVKPDVAAPGVTLYSAAVGTGSRGVSESGTSMAAPTTAGVTALIRAAHPEWSTEQVKADLMNTAGHDVHTEQGQTGEVYGPNRVGAGRIDAEAALRNQVLAYAEPGSGGVSASFGVVEVAAEKVRETKTIKVQNTSRRIAVYTVRYDAVVSQPGVRYTVSQPLLVLLPGQSRNVTVTLTATQDQLRKTPDPTVVVDGENEGRQFLGEASGRVVLRPVLSKAPTLRVPVHANPKPASTLTASAAADGSAITLAGEGIANGPAFEPTSYTSLVSAFEQLGTSPQLPRCTSTPAPTCYKSELERSVDLARVGVASDGAGGLYFGVSAHGRSTSPETAVNYGVFIDATGDGAWDYQVTTTRVADFDAPLVVVTDREFTLLPAGDPYVGFLNVADGTVDTNAFYSDVQVLAAPLSVMPLVTGRIGFGVQAVSAYGTVDDVGTTTVAGSPELAAQRMSFDPAAPGLSFDLAGEPALLVPADGGTTITVTQDPAAYAADTAVGGEKGALVVLHQNDSATGRAQSVPVAGAPVPSAAATSTPAGTPTGTPSGTSAPPSPVGDQPAAGVGEPPATSAAPTGTPAPAEAPSAPASSPPGTPSATAAPGTTAPGTTPAG